MINSPATSAYARKVMGDHAGWGVAEHLLGMVYDQLRGANWQRGGGKGPRPKPFPRPGVTSNGNELRYGSRPEGMSNDDVKAYLARAAGRQAMG